MGHHIFTRGAHSHQVHDIDLVLLKHFLTVGARLNGRSRLVEDLEKWQWIGPGVWMADGEGEILESEDAVFEQAERVVAAFGTAIPEEYIKQSIPDLRGIRISQTDTARLIGELQRLRAYAQSNN